jgi:hypothetical protein
LVASVLMMSTAVVLPGGTFVPGGVGTKLNPTVVADASRSAVTGIIPAVGVVNGVPVKPVMSRAKGHVRLKTNETGVRLTRQSSHRIQVVKHLVIEVDCPSGVAVDRGPERSAGGYRCGAE